MHWILLGVVALSLLVLAIYHPKLGFGVLITMIVILSIVVFNPQNGGLWTKQKIEPLQIEIQNPVIEPTYRGDYKLSVRLLNSHPEATLKELTLRITMKDCPASNDHNCVVIGQDEEIIDVNIPPQQARDITETLTFGSAEPTHHLRWGVTVTEAKD